MTDAELAASLGAPDLAEKVAKVYAPGSEKRARMEAFIAKADEVVLYDAGLGPKPDGVIVCHGHKHGRRARR